MLSSPYSWYHSFISLQHINTSARVKEIMISQLFHLEGPTFSSFSAKQKGIEEPLHAFHPASLLKSSLNQKAYFIVSLGYSHQHQALIWAGRTFWQLIPCQTEDKHYPTAQRRPYLFSRYLWSARYDVGNVSKGYTELFNLGVKLAGYSIRHTPWSNIHSHLQSVQGYCLLLVRAAALKN